MIVIAYIAIAVAAMIIVGNTKWFNMFDPALTTQGMDVCHNVKHSPICKCQHN